MRSSSKSATLKSWVDDLNARIVAPEKFAVKQCVAVSRLLSESRKKLDLTISPEPVVLSSSKAA
eukprot:6458453-Pyramimonas_sp.AAC.1